MLARLLATSAALLLGSATLAGAQTVTDNGTGDAQVIPLSSTVANVAPGESEWIAINWTAQNAEARELKVTATGSAGVTVGYPAFPVDGYSSGYWDDTLSENETDFTALKLTVDAEATGPLALDITVTYVSDSGSHTETMTMPIEGTGGPTNVGLAACGNEVVLNSFSQSKNHFEFSLQNRTFGDALADMAFELEIPNANHDLDRLRIHGTGENLNVARNDNGDGTFNIVISGVLPKYASIGGQQNGFGSLTPESGTPIIRCAVA